jgi:hypothetical protein
MRVDKFTREELAEYILHTAKDSVIHSIKALLSKEDSAEIVAYTVDGEPLNKEQYVREVQIGLEDIEKGNTTSDTDLDNEISNW